MSYNLTIVCFIQPITYELASSFDHVDSINTDVKLSTCRAT